MKKLHTSINEILVTRAKDEGNNIAYRILAANCEEIACINYAELYSKVAYISTILSPAVQPNDRAMLMFNSTESFIYSFYACLNLNVIAVPLKPVNQRESTERLKNVIEDCAPRILLVDHKTYESLGFLSTEDFLFNTIHIINIEEALKAYQPCQTAPSLPDIKNSQNAFIQYTSGSTGKPKGVTISHHNIIMNSEMIKNSFNYSKNTVMVSWLPLFHDMGLIGGIIQPLYTGFPCILMSPLSFIQHPVSWLKVLSRYGATTAGAPNFAYELCVFGYRESLLNDVDLSSLTLLFNGAEPIKYSTLEQFSTLYEKFGFNRNAFTPCYGMAEATLLVACKTAGESFKYIDICADELEKYQKVKLQTDNNAGIRVISVGKTVKDLDVKIVSHDLSPKFLAADQIGQIALSGENMTAGYWNKPLYNLEKFIQIHHSQHSGIYYLTGDLGFFWNNELYIIGRVDDMMIINGRNVYPDGIEHKVEHLDRLINNNGVICFQSLKGIIMLVELISSDLQADQLDTLTDSIYHLVSSEFNVNLKELHYVRKRSLPKTSSGKKMRKYCKSQFELNEPDFLSNLSRETGVNA